MAVTLPVRPPDQLIDFSWGPPQVAELNTPRSLDATGECSLYDELNRNSPKRSKT
jgi:hypothetical protein